ncbi:MAG: TIGR04076 family protein [Treponema sp.]|nr:TIGR04076 family protein [Treponema sp.]
MCNTEKAEKTMKAIEEKGIERFKEKYHCKITVLKCDFNSELYNQYPYGNASPCGRLKVGQEFISTCRWDPPEGLCVWAWRDINPVIQSYHEGREHPSIQCCTDGLRSVTFKVERIDVSE